MTWAPYDPMTNFSFHTTRLTFPTISILKNWKNCCNKRAKKLDRAFAPKNILCWRKYNNDYMEFEREREREKEKKGKKKKGKNAYHRSCLTWILLLLVILIIENLARTFFRYISIFPSKNRTFVLLKSDSWFLVLDSLDIRSHYLHGSLTHPADTHLIWSSTIPLFLHFPSFTIHISIHHLHSFQNFSRHISLSLSLSEDLSPRFSKWSS